MYVQFFEYGEEENFCYFKIREDMCVIYLKIVRAYALVILKVGNALFARERMSRWQVK